MVGVSEPQMVPLDDLQEILDLLRQMVEALQRSAAAQECQAVAMEEIGRLRDLIKWTLRSVS